MESQLFQPLRVLLINDSESNIRKYQQHKCQAIDCFPVNFSRIQCVCLMVLTMSMILIVRSKMHFEPKYH